MNAVIYARYSSDNQREESIEGQIRECKEFADRSNITILDTYIDRALSAKTDQRPEFQRMIKDSSKKLFDLVIVWKLDRFSRDRYDSAHYKAILKKNGVKVVSAKENISDGPEGIILESMLEGMAEYYSAELAVKIIRGMTENALKYKYNGGSLPLGYTTDSEQHYQVDPVTAPVVQEIFQRYADGETVTEIINSLNQRGIKTSRRNAFNKNSLHCMLKNRHFIGEYRYRDIVIPGGVPAILSPELFEQVQRRLEQNKKAPARKKAVVEYLLTTKLFCGNCGAFMVGESGTSHTGTTHYYYKCSNAKRNKGCHKKAVKKDWIEQLVVEQTKAVVLQDEAIKRIAKAVVALQKQGNNVLPLLEKQLKQTEKGIENMLNAIQQGIVTPSTKARLEELEHTKKELEISILQEKIQKPMLTEEQVVFWIGRFKDGDIHDSKYRRDLIDIFVNAVYVYDDRIVFTFNVKDGARTVTLEDIQSSDLAVCAPPKQNTTAI